MMEYVGNLFKDLGESIITIRDTVKELYRLARSCSEMEPGEISPVYNTKPKS